MTRSGLALAAAALGALVALVPAARAQAPIEGELTLITPVSKFIHDAALKAFADYAKEKWNVTVKVNAIPAGHAGGLRAHRGVEGPAGGRHLLGRGVGAVREARRAEAPAEGRDLQGGVGLDPRRRSASPSPSRSRTRTATGWAPRSSPTGSSTIRSSSSASASPQPRTGTTCSNPKLKGEVAQCAPTRSSSSNATYEVILSLYGEDKGWDWLRKLAANTGHFTARSRDVPTVVAKGEFAAGFAVPSYMAFEEKLAGFDLKFVAPKNAFVTPEPMAILAGAAQSARPRAPSSSSS